LKKTIKLDPENETATAHSAVYYNSDNKFKKSTDYRNKFLKQQPDNAAGYFQIGMIQEKLPMNDATLVSYNKVIKLNPDARDAFIAKSRIYEANGSFNLAIKEYEKYTSVFPGNMFVLIYLGNVIIKLEII
jgi:tetratricopeptide (TPR) repeat protein